MLHFIRKLFLRGTSLKARAYKGIYLPFVRSNEGLSNDENYVNSALEQVRSLSSYCDLTSHTRVLDFGCGQGRFANGLILHESKIEHYCGIDTDKTSIEWCKRWVNNYNDKFYFIHVPAYNERYNRSAEKHTLLPIEANSFDVAFLNSVFSHMLTSDITFYLSQLFEALRVDGILYFTAFIEKDVPDMEENPIDYLDKVSSGSLHRVRYEEEFFMGMIEKVGFKLIDFKHQGIERTQQSVVVVKKIN